MTRENYSLFKNKESKNFKKKSKKKPIIMAFLLGPQQVGQKVAN